MNPINDDSYHDIISMDENKNCLIDDDVTPLDIMSTQLSKHGITAQYQRRLHDGSTAPASKSDIDVLKAQAKLARTAQELQCLNFEEKTAWAIEMKEIANDMYSQGLIDQAIDKYSAALAASSFDEGVTSNVDSLVVPVLCNLAACCITKEQFSKALRLCDQALTLRPFCVKALLRRGLCLINLGEFELAVAGLRNALQVANNKLQKHIDVDGSHNVALTQIGSSENVKVDRTDKTTGNDLSNDDYKLVTTGLGDESELVASIDRIKSLLVRAQNRLRKQRESENQQKVALVKVFGGKGVNISQTKGFSELSTVAPSFEENNNRVEGIFSLFYLVCRYCCELFDWLISKWKKKKKKS